jgi:chitodextrinase
VSVAWQASPEADVAGYRVTRDGVLIADTTATSHADSTVAPGTRYGYTVTAYDTRGLTSSPSAAVSVTTPPAAPGGLTATVSGGQVTLAWGASTGATGYRAYRDGVLVYAGTATGYVDTRPVGTWVYTVTATGAGGESRSAQVIAYVALTVVIAVDATPPGLNATHTWYPAGGGPSVVFNPPPAGTLPRVRLAGEIAGWGNPPPGDDRRTTPVGRVLAERPLRSGRHGKTLTYQGVVEARNDLELRNVTGALARALGDPNMGEGRMVVEPWDGRPAVEYMARVTGYDCPEAYPSMSALGRRSRGFERGFTLQVHLSRGRMFATAWRQVNAVAGQTSLTVDVGGNAPTEPIIYLYQDVAATDSVGSRGLRLGFLTLPDANGVAIDFAARTIQKANGNIDRRGWLDRADASWWAGGQVGLIPGSYPVTRSGARGSWIVKWKDAWW